MRYAVLGDRMESGSETRPSVEPTPIKTLPEGIRDGSRHAFACQVGQLGQFWAKRCASWFTMVRLIRRLLSDPSYHFGRPRSS